MRFVSDKFKYLHDFQKALPEGVIPSFTLFTDPIESRDFTPSKILRSALHLEASQGHLGSGKSKSISGICSEKDLNTAWQEVRSQENFCEAIIQDEVPWETHITLIYENDFFFAELKSRTGHPYFIYWTPLAYTLTKETILLKNLISLIKQSLKTHSFWLMELGMIDEKLFLFQIQPVNLNFMGKIFSSELGLHLVRSRLRFSRSQNIFSLIKNEWHAHKFRKQIISASYSPANVFLNWEFIFHYYRLFCMLKKLSPNGQSFAQFLSQGFESSFLSIAVRKHLEFAHYYRTQEEFLPMDIGMEGPGIIFLGKGIISGVVGVDIECFDKIPIQSVYQKSKPKIILTKEVSLLSHPILASVENGIALVLGMESFPENGANIVVDFEKKSFLIK